MRSFINAITNVNFVNDLQDRTNVAGIDQLCMSGLLGHLRLYARRALEKSVPGLKLRFKPTDLGAVRAAEATLAAAVGSPGWRPEQSVRLLAFACTT